MEREKLESLIIDYIDNKLNSVDREKIEKELVRNSDAYKLYEELKEVMHVMDRAARLEPSSKLKSSFESMLSEELSTVKRNKTVLFTPTFYRVAAAVALFILCGSIGYWVKRYNDQQQQIAALQQEMKATKDLMMSMLHNDQSASQRIQGVNVAYTMARADVEIVSALVKTMNEDPNSNVRLAALEALSKFIGDPSVRRQLISSLSKQKDPIVQISLIQLMVQIKEKSVVKDLQRIVDDAETMKPVKDEAYSGIMKLS
jgi:HEAT repeat protein